MDARQSGGVPAGDAHGALFGSNGLQAAVQYVNARAPGSRQIDDALERFADRIAACVSDKETVDGVLLTHGHEDHTQAADDLADLFGCSVYMSMDDYVLVDPKNPLRYGYDAPVYSPIHDLRGEMTVGTFPVTIIATPGHTAGSVCIRFRSLLFTCDTLFASDIGRTDLYSGDERQMIESLKILRQLDHDLRVLPGHGPSSTIGREIKVNPYLVSLG